MWFSKLNCRWYPRTEWVGNSWQWGGWPPPLCPTQSPNLGQMVLVTEIWIEHQYVHQQGMLKDKEETMLILPLWILHKKRKCPSLRGTIAWIKPNKRNVCKFGSVWNIVKYQKAGVDTNTEDFGGNWGESSQLGSCSPPHRYLQTCSAHVIGICLVTQNTWCRQISFRN